MFPFWHTTTAFSTSEIKNCERSISFSWRRRENQRHLQTDLEWQTLHLSSNAFSGIGYILKSTKVLYKSFCPELKEEGYSRAKEPASDFPGQLKERLFQSEDEGRRKAWLVNLPYRRKFLVPRPGTALCGIRFDLQKKIEWQNRL